MSVSSQPGTIVLAGPSVFGDAFGVPLPYLEDRPHLCGLTIACAGAGQLPHGLLTRAGQHHVADPQRTESGAVAF
jgi:hypothetical protein